MAVLLHPLRSVGLRGFSEEEIGAVVRSCIVADVVSSTPDWAAEELVSRCRAEEGTFPGSRCLVTVLWALVSACPPRPPELAVPLARVFQREWKRYRATRLPHDLFTDLSLAVWAVGYVRAPVGEEWKLWACCESDRVLLEDCEAVDIQSL
eukprot:Hpha_TRINITY_DN32645_c0_g1::TRINITY_DN32645_c0_g1_i1::g.30378::m.30378